MRHNHYDLALMWAATLTFVAACLYYRFHWLWPVWAILISTGFHYAKKEENK